MSQFLACTSIAKAFAAQKLFEGIDLVLHAGDKLGVIGPNGSGKSTFLKILCGLEEADDGQIIRRKNLRIGYLAQADLFDESQGIFENLLNSLDGEAFEEQEKYVLVQTILSRAQFTDTEKAVAELSGGWKKRLAICRAILARPDLLVLDEPTNHLDIAGILWLEGILNSPVGPAACILVSHDRCFWENCTNRVVELSSLYPRGTLQVQGNYARFLEMRQRFLDGQLAEESQLANKARREIEWLRRGPKARSTKAKFRIDQAHRLTNSLAEVKARNRALSRVQIDFADTGRKSKLLLEARGISKAYADRVLFQHLDLRLSPGERLGILGNNGCGKSTLMNILAGAGRQTGLRPDEGEIRTADNLQIVSFEQNRAALDTGISLRRALAPEGDSVVFRGQLLHVVSWAGRFLFRPEQLETPVARLSGGEQARILIANLMRTPADVLLLDEPTNDLDITSLTVLEESLLDFPGALVLVSHDRCLLDRVCQRFLGFGGRSGVSFYADYRQWLADLPAAVSEKQVAKKRHLPEKTPPQKGRLSYMDQRQYDRIEDDISTAEAEVDLLQEQMQRPEVAADREKLSACWTELAAAEARVEALYERWAELEEQRKQR
ncbi:MAG: ABC transporter ATP-binding protein [Deltaproteobacteria bacterium]|nr:MAG: ABC transporter ATP-binding protein [Deltaproteobacteria bacterium]